MRHRKISRGILLAAIFLIGIPMALSQDDSDVERVQLAVPIDKVWFGRVDSTLKAIYKQLPPLPDVSDAPFLDISFYDWTDTTFRRHNAIIDNPKETYIIIYHSISPSGDDHYVIPFNGYKYLINKKQSPNIVKPIKRYLLETIPYRIFFDLWPTCIVQDSVGNMSLLTDEDRYYYITE